MEGIVKYLGAIMILLSGSLLGWFASLSYLRRINDLLTIKKIINIIDNEIIGKQGKLIDIFEIAAKQIDSPVRKILINIIRETKNNPDKEFYEIWKMVFKKSKKFHYFTEGDIQILDQWASQLGKINLEKQKKVNQITQKRLSEQLDEAKKEAEKKKKLVRYSGVLLSLLIIILFY